jgi:hypothetical protein
MEAIGSKVLFLILLVSVADKIIYSCWNLSIAWFDLSVLVVTFSNSFLPILFPLSLLMNMYSEFTSRLGHLNT